MNTKLINLYALFDPRNPLHIRYIGSTIGKIEERLRNEIYEATVLKVKTPRCIWIRKVIREKSYPQTKLLTICESRELEAYYIERYREEGHQLTNLAIGGEGSSGWHQTEETKQILRKKNTGRKFGEDFRKKMRERVQTAEWIERRSKALKGRSPSPQAHAAKRKWDCQRRISRRTKKLVDITVQYFNTLTDHFSASIDSKE